MKITLYFKNIVEYNGVPEIQVLVNSNVEYTGIVKDTVSLSTVVHGEYALAIKFTNKNPQDTLVEDGKIVKDKSFELDKIIIDDYSLDSLIWNSTYTANDGNCYPGCLFFGPAGQFEIKLASPILFWILQQQNPESNAWVNDYDCYMRAWNRLHSSNK